MRAHLLSVLAATLLASWVTHAEAQAAPVETAPPATTPPTFARLRFAAQAEPAWGVSGGSFYNQLAGVRLDYRFTDSLALGPYVGYANLKGQEGRAHNVLSYLALEYRPRLGDSASLRLPLRFATGYLPQNGPVLRLSAGVSYALSPSIEIALDAFTPTFWVVRDRTVVSLGAALEISYAPSFR
jgi:hypothetical protein